MTQNMNFKISSLVFVSYTRLIMTSCL